MILKDEAYGGQLFADLGVLGIFFQHLLEAEACVLEHAELEAVVAYFHPGICFGGIAESQCPLCTGQVEIVLFHIDASLEQVGLCILGGELFCQSAKPVGFFRVALAGSAKCFV